MAMDMPLRTVKTNIVQSIRAFRVADLQTAASQLGYHFLYANLAGPKQARYFGHDSSAIHVSTASRQKFRYFV